MYWRGGPTPTADCNVTLLGRARRSAAAPTINWTNCLRTQPVGARAVGARARARGRRRPRVRPPPRRGLRAHLGERPAARDLNGPQQRMQEGARGARLVASQTIVRNTDPSATTTRASAGYIGFGDQSGSKQSHDRRPTSRTPSTHGAEIVVALPRRARAGRGRPRGRRRGDLRRPRDGRARRGSPSARRSVVVACGVARVAGAAAALAASAARRSATTCACTRARRSFGIYGEDQQAWWGAAAGRPRRRVRRRRGRLRLPDRERAVRARR